MSKPMAFNDRIKQVAVYFGLAEQHVDGYDYADEEYERPARRAAAPAPAPASPGRRRSAEDIDDIFGDEPVASPRASYTDPSGFGDVRVHLVLPKSFNDAQQMADRYKDGTPVILNLQGVEPDLSRRLIDFASGLTYALDGGMQRIADKVFMLTPHNVELSAEQRQQLLEKGFFNQS